MLPDKSDLKLLSSNPSGLRALLDYLEALKAQTDAEYDTAARKFVFAPDARDSALLALGKNKAIDDLLRTINSVTSITRGE